MSKSITEKELAEKLQKEYRTTPIVDNAWERIAREPAELLGVELAPEKPEPGTWHFVEDGDYQGYPARVYSRIELHIFHPTGATYSITTPGAWPALEPARVVAASERLVSEAPGWEQDLLTGTMRKTPAEPVELSGEEVGALYDGQRYGQARLFNSLHEDVQGTIGAAIHDALAKHGHGRVEVSRAEVGAALIAGLEKTMAIITPKTVKHATNAVRELLEASK